MLVIIYPFVQLGPEHQLYPSLKDSLRAFAKIVVVSRIFSTSSVRQSYFQRSLLQRAGGRALGCQIKQGMIQICLVRKGYHSFPAIIEFSTHVLLQMLFMLIFTVTISIFSLLIGFLLYFPYVYVLYFAANTSTDQQEL